MLLPRPTGACGPQAVALDFWAKFWVQWDRTHAKGLMSMSLGHAKVKMKTCFNFERVISIVVQYCINTIIIIIAIL